MDELLSETVSLSEGEMIAANPPEPKSIGSGIVKSVLGKGGASVVYEIWNPKLEINRAVKLWRPVQSEKTIQRFENEIKITAKLHHPNIVDIYTVGEWNGLPFIEMEKIQGTDIKELIKSRGAIPEVVAVAVAVCICRALIYAHNHEYVLSGKKCKGVIHCDIKPANIMISENGIVKLMDFGIAHPSNSTMSTEKSSITGSLQYMSPEQLDSDLLDCRSDLYSLGVLLYELLSGTKAFPASTIKELIQKRKKNEFSPLGSFCKNISARARAIVEKLMKTDPDQRFQSAEALMEEIQKDYQNLTSDSPEVLISRFLAGEKIKKSKNKNKLSKLMQLSFFFFVLSFSAFIIFLWSSRKLDVTHSFQVNTPNVDTPKIDSIKTTQISQNDRSADTISSINIKRNTAVNGIKNSVSMNRRAALKGQYKTRSAEFAARNVESVLKTGAADQQEVSDNMILDEMNRLLGEGQLSQTERMLQEFPIKDGEYHLIYAELLIKRKQLKAAMVEAEKALRVAAGRISPSELREKVLYYKARILSAEYENSPDKQNGQKAMEAWYDVKYALRSNTEHLYYKKADTEIRRISVLIQ
ncbi:MAG TPA: serine/threonine-protein kinase [Chitinispirillaceae bacterium]|nr:serine/threonine-protein kinase [Chitinispirillaceae bacterium]